MDKFKAKIDKSRQGSVKPLRSENVRKLDNLQRTCLNISQKVNRNLNELKIQRNEVEKVNETFDRIVDAFKGLEGIEANVIGGIYKYRKIDKEEKYEESKAITKEYKSGVRDPSRIVARMEKSTTNRRKIMQHYTRNL